MKFLAASQGNIYTLDVSFGNPPISPVLGPGFSFALQSIARLTNSIADL